MKKNHLLAPGPTPVPERVAAVLGQPIPHHRTPGFEKAFAEAREGLKALFGTKQEVITLCASGTGAMEAAVSNLFSRGEKVIVVNGGKFGERWMKIAKAYGLSVVEIRLEGGESVQVEAVWDACSENRVANAVLVQASES
jgi:aspartate aminotransferase-like enzyme